MHLIHVDGKIECRLSGAQYAYRPNKSTETALAMALDMIKKSTYSALSNFDLSRAFERVGGSRAVNTLLNWGTHPALANCIRILIARRQFKTEVRRGEFRCRSKPNAARLGAPQGSSLGPLLSVADVNSLLTLLESRNIQVVMYSDDIGLVYNIDVTHDSNTIEALIQEGIDIVWTWRLEQKHMINITKCSFTLFKPRDAKDITLNLRIGDQALSRKEAVRYLGVELDIGLTGEARANSVINKIKRRTIGLYLLRGSTWGASARSCLLWYKAMVWDAASYCLSVYFNWMSGRNRSRIQVALNIGLRAVLLAPVPTRLGILWKETRTLSLSESGKLRCILLYYRLKCFDGRFDEQGHFATRTQPYLHEIGLHPNSYHDEQMSTLDNRILRNYHKKHFFDWAPDINTNQMFYDYCGKREITYVFCLGGSLEGEIIGSSTILFEVIDALGGGFSLVQLDSVQLSGNGNSSYAAEMQALLGVNTILARRPEIKVHIGVFSDSQSVLRKCHDGPSASKDSYWALSLCYIRENITGYWAHVRSHVGVDGDEKADVMANRCRIHAINWQSEPAVITWDTFRETAKRKFEERQKATLIGLEQISHTVRYYKIISNNYRDNEHLAIPPGMEIPYLSKILLNLRTGDATLMGLFRTKYKIGAKEDERKTRLLCEDDEATLGHILSFPALGGLQFDVEILRNPIQAQQAFAPKIFELLQKSTLLSSRKPMGELKTKMIRDRCFST